MFKIKFESLITIGQYIGGDVSSTSYKESVIFQDRRKRGNVNYGRGIGTRFRWWLVERQ